MSPLADGVEPVETAASAAELGSRRHAWAAARPPWSASHARARRRGAVVGVGRRRREAAVAVIGLVVAADVAQGELHGSEDEHGGGRDEPELLAARRGRGRAELGHVGSSPVRRAQSASPLAGAPAGASPAIVTKIELRRPAVPVTGPFLRLQASAASARRRGRCRRSSCSQNPGPWSGTGTSARARATTGSWSAVHRSTSSRARRIAARARESRDATVPGATPRMRAAVRLS